MAKLLFFVDKLKLLFLTGVVGVFTALTYYVFEFAVHNGIDLIWDTLFNTENYRWRIFPLCIALTIVFFGFRHLLDKSTDRQESHSLGNDTFDVSIKGFTKVLFIGFWSLVAGPSLGPEAILIPASVILGMYLSEKVLPDQEEAMNIMKGAGLVALFAAFFHSFFIGFLSLFVMSLRSDKIKLNLQLILIAMIASGTSTITLNIISPSNQYFNWPAYSLTFRLADLAIAILLISAGYFYTWSVHYSHNIAVYFRNFLLEYPWWVIAVSAGLSLSILYFAGGPLIEFTGNKSIQPLFLQANSLGIRGLLWILLLKIFAIGWSKALWYRGGMIFPTFFVAGVIVAGIGQFYSEINFMLGIVAIMTGALIADRRAKVLL